MAKLGREIIRILETDAESFSVKLTMPLACVYYSAK